MRHRVQHRKFNRTTSHRRALLRNLAQSMIEHGQVRTTLQKAKDLRPVIERLVTLAKSANGGSITARRRIHRILSDRSMIAADRRSEYADMALATRRQALRARSGRRHRMGAPLGKLKFTGESITRRLLAEIAPRFEDRPGGYTRVVKLAQRRIGDGGYQAIVQFVGDEQSPGSITKPRKSARRVRADARYAMAVQRGRKAEAGKSAPVDNDVPKDQAQPQPSDAASSGSEDDTADNS